MRWARRRGAIQIPVAHGVWLRLEGGDGKTGIGWGELGVRYLERGRGQLDAEISGVAALPPTP